MADRKVTVWNNDGYQEILRTRVNDADPGDRLVVDGGGGTKFDTNVGFFGTTPIAQQTGTTLAPAALLKALADALNAFGLTDITFDSNIETELDELQSLLDNPVNITGTAPISATAGSSAPDLNNWTIAIAAATESSLGAMQVGNGLDVTAEGIVSVDATEITSGINLGVTTSATENEITNTAGDNATLVGASSTDAGLLTSTLYDKLNDLGSASDSQEGLIQIATLAEIITGTDNTKAISPDGLAGALNEEGAVIGDDTDRTDDGYTIDCGVYYTDP